MGRTAAEPLADQLRDDVSDDVRARGRRWFESGAVRIDHGGSTDVRATVFAAEPYDVAIQFERAAETLVSLCACPSFFDTGDVCEHIWATVLAAQSKGHLARAARAARTGFVTLEPAELDGGTWGHGGFDDGLDHCWGSDFTGADPRTRQAVAGPGRGKPPARRGKPDWRDLLSAVRDAMENRAPTDDSRWPADRRLFYVIDLPATRAEGELALEVAVRDPRRAGGWGTLKSLRIRRDAVARFAEAADREILAAIDGTAAEGPAYYRYRYPSRDDDIDPHHTVPPDLQRVVLPMMCATGRCLLRRRAGDKDPPPLAWDPAPPWALRLEVAESGPRYAITGELRRGDDRLSLSQLDLITAGGIAIAGTRVMRFESARALPWVAVLRERPTIEVPAGRATELLERLMTMPQQVQLGLPESLRVERVEAAPVPRLVVRPPRTSTAGRDQLRGELSFEYEGAVVEADAPAGGVFRADERRYLARDAAAERAAVERLRTAGFRDATRYAGRRGRDFELRPDRLAGAVRALVRCGWHVEAEGAVYRQAGAVRHAVSSGVDWFELRGEVDFGGQQAPLPELLRAFRKGDKFVRLGDGSFGVLPDEWLRRVAPLIGLGEVKADHVRLAPSQISLLDALLDAEPGARGDAAFEKARARLHGFDRVRPRAAPSGFRGRLRAYQRDGLGWLDFLGDFGFGGCLADDMGLGKTIQVLALLEARRERPAGADGDAPRPSLVVVPRSLVFNWIAEAARFTPRLRVLNHTGPGRAPAPEGFADHDVVVTTYGTMVRDIERLQGFRFDYAVLDEAQAIKNAGTHSARAARLIRADHRLALSGTPIENHLGELWSLFEFLNPGMLGAGSRWSRTAAAMSLRNPDDEQRRMLAQIVRPFVLRRTKQHVAADLPPKTEQTLYCELSGRERRRYDELRDHYRRSLAGRLEREGLGRTKLHVLEALLRLRQAACHPGLLDRSRTGEPSAKLELLLDRLGETVEENHKALVFSQFTSLLAVVRRRLDERGVTYEYLDGRTRKRARRVERFQGDPDCRLFLVSLKAGGLGLNLTAADYVFLLDPWWNPAVEAQAVDRTHRIGQTRPVVAYRLIARDTVEERVLELQQSKRDLAESIITADNGLIRTLTRADLAHLLS